MENKMDYRKIYEINRDLNGLKDTDLSYSLYYDETNNPRTFILSDTGFNYDESAYFILGGIGFTFPVSPDAPTIVDLYKKFGLQKSATEIKFKHIRQGADDLVNLLIKPRAQVLLDWLLQTKEIFIHYNFLDNFYFSIVDIIDSLDHAGLLRKEFNRDLKDSLFTLLTQDKKWFVNLMIEVNYPNIRDVKRFVEEIISKIEEINPYGEDFILEYLRQILKSARNKGLPLLQDNVDGELIDNFSLIYAQSIWNFPKATHLFDHEFEIEKILQDNSVEFDGTKLNYDWEDSKNNKLLQLSDLVVGILRYWTAFLNETPLDELDGRLKSLSNEQRIGLKKLQTVMIDSLNVNSAFKIGIASNNFELKVLFFLGYDF